MINVKGIEGPFGWLRGGRVLPNGSPYECDLEMSNDECGNDIFPEQWNNPNRDLTQREVMKAIIGYGLRYTDPGRFGGPDECKNERKCRYNENDQSLLQNAYEHATGDSPHPRFENYKPKYTSGYTARVSNKSPNCSDNLMIFGVRTVRCSDCLFKIHCSMFEMFGHTELFDLFAVPTVRL